jgi:hypothetical protein
MKSYRLLVFAILLLALDFSTSGKISSTMFADKKIYGAVINTDPQIASVLGRDFHRVPQGVNGTATENANQRLQNSKILISSLPVAIDSWWSVYAPSCPGKVSKGNDRGVTMAHFQIWFDFIFQSRSDEKPDTSVILVFEDDAVIAVENVTSSLETELQSMDTDLLFLGWCYGRNPRHMPMCTHAYALTRAGAKKMIDSWDICSAAAIDGQWKHLSRDGVFTWKKANPLSYAKLRAGFEDNPDYFTRGIFIQKNGLVSFNHHGFQNNAG